MAGAADRVHDAEWVSVVGDEDSPAPVHARQRRPIRLGWVGALLAGALIVLLLLPAGDPPPEQMLARGEIAPPVDDRLLPWPGRGPWAANQRFVTEAATAWRDAARSDRLLEGPGDEVVPLWAGPVLGAKMALLQSLGPDGVVRVAQVSDMLHGWLQPQLRLLSTARVDAEPAFLVFPFVGPDDRRGQLDPDVLATFQMLPGPLVSVGERRVLRLEGRRLVPVEVRDDGLSEPWAYGRWWQRQDPEVALLTRGDDGSLVSSVRLDPDSLLPAAPPFELVEPAWGTDVPYGPEDYVAAAAALESVGSSSGAASVLGSASTSAGRVSLVGIQPSDGGRPGAVVVVQTDEGLAISGARPLDPEAQVAIGAVRTQEGSLVVVAAASPQTSLLTIDADGFGRETLDRAQAMVLPPDVDVDVVEARAFRGDDLPLAEARIGAEVGDPPAADGS